MAVIAYILSKAEEWAFEGEDFLIRLDFIT